MVTKKLSILFLCLCLVASLFGQEDGEFAGFAKNDLKINVLYGILGAFDVGYERLLNENSSVGLDASIQYDDEVLVYQNYVAAHYRWYPNRTYVSGIFLEGSLALATEELASGNETYFGPGVGAGGKFVHKANWFAEVFLRINRDLISEYDDTIARLGISLGKRF